MDKTQLKAAAAYAGKTFSDVAEGLGVSRQAFTQKAGRGSWTTNDLEKIAEIIGAEYKSVFVFPDGKEI